MATITSKLRFIISKCKYIPCTNFQDIQIRHSSFKSSPFVSDLENADAKYEISNDPEEWKYVERILPIATVPKPTQKIEYPSQWKPQSEDAFKNPFFVQRNKNHMMPVYMKSSQRGQKRLTYIKKVQGDIWLLEKEIKELLQKNSIKPIRSQVNEFVGHICIHGDHVNAIKDYLLNKNC